MKRGWRWTGLGALLVVVLACLGASMIYVLSGLQLRKTYEVALRPIAVPTDAESIAEGRRLATIRGCNDGCHGKGVSGGEFWSVPWVGTMVAPDLTRVAASHSDAELERVIRHGVRKNGRSTWGMPSAMFHHLTDEDLGRTIAFLRSLPPGKGPETKVWFGPLGRIDLIRHPEYAYAEEIAADAPWLGEADLKGEHGAGRYLAITVCTECHGMDLKGNAGDTPDLAIVAAYSEQQFEQLMKTGQSLRGEIGLMSDVARSRFSHFTDAELQVLHRYLQHRAKEPT